MSAQHKRPGRTARLARQKRARERELLKCAVIVRFPRPWEGHDGISLGRLVMVGEFRLEGATA